MTRTVFFDVRNLYYLPQYEPVARELERRGIRCHFVFYDEKGQDELTRMAARERGLDAAWATDTGNAAEHYRRERPDWVIFGHVFQEPLPEGIGRALIFHSVGPKAGRYEPNLDTMQVRFVESEHYMERVRACGFKADLALTGYAKLDPLFDASDENGGRAQPEVVGLNGLDPDKRTILYAPTYFPSSIERLPDDFPEQIADLNFVVKPHYFSLMRPKYEKQRRKLRLWAEFPNTYIAKPEEYSILPFMRCADALVSDNSSAAFEFCALDRPIVLCDFMKLRLSYRGPFRYRMKRRLDTSTEAYRNIGVHAKKPEELSSKLYEALEHPEAQAEERRRCARELVGATDGQASVRIADYLTSSTLGGVPRHS